MKQFFRIIGEILGVHAVTTLPFAGMYACGYWGGSALVGTAIADALAGLYIACWVMLGFCAAHDERLLD